MWDTLSQWKIATLKDVVPTLTRTLMPCIVETAA